MKNYFRFALGGMLLLSLVSCANLQVSKEPVYAKADSKQGVIYFYREPKFEGNLATFHVNEGSGEKDNFVGALASGTYFFLKRSPGKYTFWVKGDNKRQRTVNLSAGETVYVRGDIQTGFWTGQPTLMIVSSDEGSSAIEGLKHATLKK